jgi:hypothetical protein
MTALSEGMERSRIEVTLKCRWVRRSFPMDRQYRDEEQIAAAGL